MENSVQTAAMLLEETSVINKQSEARYMKTGEMYNVFKAAGIHEDERKMCRVLADLLDPKGLHYRKETYLKLFMDMVVIPAIKKDVALDSKAEVRCNYPTDKGKFIDIVISDGKVFIPIEAKIKADDSKDQLNDYYAESLKKNMNGEDPFIPVLFLTKDGHESDKATRDKYEPISFKDDIIRWLKACLDETKEAEPVREMLKQYIKAIKSFCGILEDEEMAKEIKDLIMEKGDNYKSALLIKKAVDEININGKVWEIFESQIPNQGICYFVLKKFPDMDAWPEERPKIFCYNIKLGNGLTFSVSHNIKEFWVKKPEEPLSDERNNKIIRYMSEITKDCNTAKENFIWTSKNGRYPGLEEHDGDLEKYDDDRYYYELYKIYSTNPQKVADWIVSIAEELAKI